MSRIKSLARMLYSNPPIHGARIAAKILNSQANFDEWMAELNKVVARMTKMRALLKEALEKKGAKGNWDHITKQIGMFSFTGLSTVQSERMVAKHHIYMTKNGRISVAGLTTENVDYVAEAIKECLENA